MFYYKEMVNENFLLTDFNQHYDYKTKENTNIKFYYRDYSIN